MTRWLIKAALQGAMSQLPDPQRANRVFQRLATGRLNLSDAFFDKKLVVAERHLDNWRTATSASGVPSRLLELGTGWHPVVPVAFALRGVDDVMTVDLAPLFGDEQIIETLQAFRSRIHQQPEDFAPNASALVDKALELAPGDPFGRLAAVGVSSLVADASALDMDTASIDMVTSNNTLEHIPVEPMASILSEFRRVIRPDGVSSHLIDLADHYAGFDAAITPYNFLQFSERRWALCNNTLQYQNRLRHSQYLDIFAEAGWQLLDEHVEGDQAQLQTVNVHNDFRHLDDADLAVHTSWVTHRPN